MKQEYLNLIRKYVNGLADPREKSFVEYLFSNYENDLTLRNYLSNEWEEILSGKLSHSHDLTHVLNKIHGQMRNDYQKPEKQLRRRFFRTYEKIAAVILIPVLLAFSFVYHRQSVIRKEIANKVATSMIYAPVGSRVSFSLPDGTTGMLNNDSHLTYSLPFTHNRHVTLEGEAWFDVKKDEQHPFTINAGNTCLKVLGTSFNLSAYKDENKVEIVLQKGKIEFINDRKDQRSIILPSEKLIYQEGKVNKTFVDPSKYTSWTEGKLVFKGEPMGEVIRKIERCYSVKIILADREIENYSFRGTFKDDKIEDVIRFICMTSSLDYKIIHRDRLTNVPEKDVVTIFRKN